MEVGAPLPQLRLSLDGGDKVVDALAAVVEVVVHLPIHRHRCRYRRRRRLRALRASGETLELGSTAALPLSGGGASGVPAITFSSNLHLHSGQARFSCGGSTRSYALALLVPAFCLFPVWNVSMCFGRQDPHKP